MRGKETVWCRPYAQLVQPELTILAVIHLLLLIILYTQGYNYTLLEPTCFMSPSAPESHHVYDRVILRLGDCRYESTSMFEQFTG